MQKGPKANKYVKTSDDVQTSKVPTVSEIISGSLPLEKRSKLLEILSGKKCVKVLVESAPTRERL